MNKAVYDEGVKHLLKVEPNFKKILPEEEINFFARPQGFAGILHLVIEQQVSVQSANAIKKKVQALMSNVNSCLLYTSDAADD